MAFSTRCFQNALCKLAALLLAACVLLPAWAAENSVHPVSTSAEYASEHIELNARFQLGLSQTLEDALANGLTLPFTYEFQLTRPRLYAWYRQAADSFNPTASLTYRLTYHSLSRQYRVNYGSFYRGFASLDEALSALGVVRNWNVLADTGIAKDKDPFAGKIRLRLDVSQLPKPFQLSTMGQGDWKLESGWIDVSSEGGGS
ncbi:protein of unknown function [Andreprevotia lacus DSM 23236]|uniref:DUF4390 domain-containing protein n=1 Tax=Andreprevotia lacus DSM 23236 TaxID=1121001 RepID=A0A1W1XXZ1_9NEIS|nr:protein of unknown function [Andreprevotia lacus DSM 23236]